MSAEPRSLAEQFSRQSINRLRHDYLPKIERCLEVLDPADLWWRPNENSNSIGNLLLHLSGNVRQWIMGGLDGAPDVRRRAEEFETDGGPDASTLLAALTRTVETAAEVIEKMGESALLEERNIQGYAVTGLSAVYHVVEHFAGHVGQVVWITKMRVDRDLGFYASKSS